MFSYTGSSERPRQKSEATFVIGLRRRSLVLVLSSGLLSSRAFGDLCSLRRVETVKCYWCCISNIVMWAEMKWSKGATVVAVVSCCLRAGMLAVRIWLFHEPPILWFWNKAWLTENGLKTALFIINLSQCNVLSVMCYVTTESHSVQTLERRLQRFNSTTLTVTSSRRSWSSSGSRSE